MRQAAFLRAINVGTHNRIKMTELRALCEGVGLGNVTTYLQTGNLLFDADGEPEAVAVTIEQALVERGLRNAAVIVRSLDELDELMACEAFEPFAPDAYTRFVTLFRGDLPAHVQEFVAENDGYLLARQREVLAVLPTDRPRGVDLNGNLEKKLKVQGTTRYWHVVEEMTLMLRG